MKEKFKISKITRGSILIALGVLLPQIFHLLAGGGSGEMFLPMHIPVLLGGIMLGPIYGLIIGVLVPILSSVFTGMPPLQILPLMMCELACYGFIIGVLYRKLKDKRFGVMISLLIAMVAGRLVFALLIVLLGTFINLIISGPQAVLYAFIKGMPGIIIQIIIIPIIIKGLKAVGYVDGN